MYICCIYFDFEGIVVEFDVFKGLRCGMVLIDLVESVVECLLLVVISLFWKSYLGIYVNVLVVLFEEVVCKVEVVEVDVGFMFDLFDMFIFILVF